MAEKKKESKKEEKPRERPEPKEEPKKAERQAGAKKEDAKPESPKGEQSREETKEEKPEAETTKTGPKAEETKAGTAAPESQDKAAVEAPEKAAPAEKAGHSKELINKVLEAVTIAKSTGKVSRGVNEATKSIERGYAKLVVIAEDVEPKEIVMHLPVLCREKKVPCVRVPGKLELGRASGIEVQTSAIAITEEGDSKRLVADIASKV